MVRWNMILSGRVQHVGLRFRAKMTAQQLGLTGWVRNLDDGNVELELQGEQETIYRFINQPAAYWHRSLLPWEQETIYRFINTLGSLPGIQFSIIHAKKLEPESETRFGIR